LFAIATLCAMARVKAMPMADVDRRRRRPRQMFENTFFFFLRKEYDCRSLSVCQLGQTNEILLAGAMSKASVAKEPLTTVGNLM